MAGSWIHRFALATALAVLAIGPAACSGAGAQEDGETAEEESADALVNCASNPSRLYFDVRETYDGKPTSIYSDPSLSKPIGSLKANSRVSVRLADPELGSMFSRLAASIPVREETTTSLGWTGWLRVDALRLATPATGECASGATHAVAASPAMRMASTDYGLSASLARSALSCSLGLGTGVAQGAKGLVEGLAATAKLVPKVITESSAVLGDMMLASVGHDEAIARLKDQALSGKARLEAGAAVVGHAMPALHQYLRDQYVYYDGLPPDEQSGMLCRIMGRIAFETVTVIATPGGLVKGGVAVKGAIEAAQVEAVVGAKLSGRAAGSIIVDLKTMQTMKETTWSRYMDENRWKTVLAAEQKTQAAWMAEHEAKYAALLASTSVQDRLTKMAELAQLSNPASRLRITGGGNCAFASLTTLTMLASGHPQCALPQFDMDHFTNAFDSELLRLGGKTATRPGYNVDAGAMMKAAEALEENQMAHLASYSGRGAHGTMVVRMGGRLWHVNNQNWEAFETLEQWTQRWGRNGPVYYVLWTTEQRIPFRAALTH